MCFFHFMYNATCPGKWSEDHIKPNGIYYVEKSFKNKVKLLL